MCISKLLQKNLATVFRTKESNSVQLFDIIPSCLGAGVSLWGRGGGVDLDAAEPRDSLVQVTWICIIQLHYNVRLVHGIPSHCAGCTSPFAVVAVSDIFRLQTKVCILLPDYY